MKFNQLLLIGILFSTLLHSEPNPFDNLVLTETKTKSEENRTIQSEKGIPETNKTTILQNDKNISVEPIDKELIEKFRTALKKDKKLLKNITHKRFLRRFYRQNNYALLWIGQNGIEHKKLQSLFQEIEKDITIDSKSKIFKYLNQIKGYIAQKEYDPLRVELQLTSLYIDFLKHTLYGSIDWKNFTFRLKNMRKRGIAARWIRYRPQYSISELLLQPNIGDTIEEITPKRFGYIGLLKSLIKLRTIQESGGWKKLPKFKKLELNDSGQSVLELRERLKISSDLKECEKPVKELFESDTETVETEVKIQPEAHFDLCLEEAVKRFQHRHGLEEDGIVGAGTREALNRSVESKIETVLLNIDRIKWLPREDNKRYLVANIPEYMLHYIEDNVEKKTIRIIVGDRRHHTPIFKEQISYVVLNPYWKVSKGIVKREIIPAMIRNPNYIKKEGLEIHTTWYERSPRVDPYSIYWPQYYYGYEFGMQEFPYRIMQPPGPKNALGKIKFKFPNKFDVYLHDTPTKKLFKKTHRAFSHGCMRIAEPYSLLETVASFNDSIDMNKSKKILKGKRKVQLNIENKLPIYIVYLTAGYDNRNDELLFRNDIYSYDKIQKRVK